MAHRFEIRKNKAGEFVSYFMYNAETIFWTEGYSSKAGAKNAIEFDQGKRPGRRDGRYDDRITDVPKERAPLRRRRSPVHRRARFPDGLRVP